MKRFFLFLSLLLICSNTFSKDLRIISTMPSLTEMVYFLGMGDSLVGVSPYCQYPEEAKKLPKIGTALVLDLEKIIQLKTNLVLLPTTKDSRSLENIKSLGLDHILVGYERLTDITKSLWELNAKFKGHKDIQIKEFEESFIQHEKISKRVLIIISEEIKSGKVVSVRAAGSETIYGDLLDKLGVINSLSASYSLYPELGLEQLLKLKFDYIIRVGARENRAARSAWKDSLFASKMRFIFKDYAVVTGPRLRLLYDDMKKVVR